MLADSLTLHVHFRSCQSGITVETLGLLGKVSGGAIQVVQNVSAIPSDVHPRNKLNGEFDGALPALPPAVLGDL